MNTDKKAKTDRIALRIDKALKSKIQVICANHNSSLSQLITSLLKQYIDDNDISNNEVIVKIPIDKVAHARINLYALEHGTTVEDVMLFSTLKTIKENNDVRH